MENEYYKEIPKNKGTASIVVIVILSILLVGALGYIGYDKLIKTEEPKEEEKENKTEVKEELVTENKISMKTDCNAETCSKEETIAYNNKNHKVKIEQVVTTDTTNIAKITYNISIDGTLVNSIDGGNVYKDDTSKIQYNFTIYSVDNKYLAIGYEEHMTEVKSNLYLAFYNDNKYVTNKQIKIGSQGFYKDGEDKAIILELDDIPFDGSNFTYYGCNKGIINESKLKFDGQSLNEEMIKNREDLVAVGASC